jgi:uncharacterized protein (TIGR02118 family)
MIKVSVLYPIKSDTHFDMDYYVSKHIPLCQRLLGKGLRKTEVDAGLAGAGPGEPPTFYGGVQFYYDSVEAFGAVFGPAAAEITADIPKYTNSPPIIQFNEIKVSG